jgi:hypothetical protein
VPDIAFRSSRTTRLLCSAVLTLALCAIPATASASSANPAVAHAAQSQQRAQARAERKAERQAAKQQRQAARQAQRSARQAERDQRHATRAAERAQRAGAADSSGETPAQGETPPTEVKTEGPKTGSEGQRALATHKCTLTATASAPQVLTGESVTISGKLTCPSATDAATTTAAAAAAEQEITVYQRQGWSDQAGAAVAGTTTTASDGSYELHSGALVGRSVFLVRTASVRNAARAVVLVNGGVSLQGPAANASSLPMGAGKGAAGRVRQTFTGAIEPAQAGRQVALRVRYAGGEWRTVAFARTDTEGHFSFSHRFRTAGDVEVIAVARPRGTQRSESPLLTYTIVAAGSPAPALLSPAPAPAPVPAPAAPVTSTPAPTGETTPAG